MSWSQVFSLEGQRQWHCLEDLVQSALADVISADAHFQLKQAEAWSQFGDSIRELSDNPILQSIDLSVGFGRLENLALHEMSLNLDLEVYRAPWFKRTWWGMKAFFGYPKPQSERVFRLCRSGSDNKNTLSLMIKAKRNQNGVWEVDNDSLPDALGSNE